MIHVPLLETSGSLLPSSVDPADKMVLVHGLVFSDWITFSVWKNKKVTVGIDSDLRALGARFVCTQDVGFFILLTRQNQDVDSFALASGFCQRYRV